ncbi:MAG: hypothetical protein RIF33_10065 [Cyclobacteriaceae bacterium]
MKVGIIILCRYNSSRLPGKILMEIKGKPILAYILERLALSKYAKNIVIATSDQLSDDPIAEFCEGKPIKLFRGSLENVSRRFLDCAVSFDLDYAVRVNGDNLFADHNLLDAAVDLAIAGRHDFVTNVKGRTFPTGMSVEVVNTRFYKKQAAYFDAAEYLEHVTSYFYEHPDAGNFEYIYNETIKSAHGLKLAVDCEEDLNFVSLLLTKMKMPHTSYGWQDIVNLAVNEE